jgi:Spy/CpxP family protein refolding chaperone
MGIGPCAADLNLSAEQIKQMQDLRTQFLNDSAQLREKLLAKKTELRSLWAQNAPDEGAIMSKQKEVNELRTQLQAMATQHRLEARKGLTPEQQTQMQSCLSDTGNFGPGSGKRGGGCGPGRGMGMGPGDCPRF